MTALDSGTRFIPKSVIALRNYSFKKFLSDLVAGITVGLVALPLAMAFAIASGVPPQSGIYCAIIAGFLISALGGSNYQIGGPTGAFVVVVAGIVQKYGIDGLFMCTAMAGCLLMLLGVTGLGTAVKFIPRPVVIGFTNGIAVLIASTQIKEFFGLRIEHDPGEFLARMQSIGQNWNSLSPTATLVSAGSMALIILMMIFFKRVPGAIIALIVGTAIVYFFRLPLETVQTKFGGIPSGLPHFTLPQIRPDLILPLLSPVLTITMLGAIESLLSAVVADRMTGDKHNPNVELFAQGVANVASPMFGGLPATGAIARTATSIRSGAKTPVAGMIHAITLLVILMVGTSLAGQIPLCILAAILMVVAYNMGEWREIPEIVRLGKAPTAVWAVTFLLTVLADLTVAVEAGMILAMFLFVRRVTTTTTVERVSQEYIDEGVVHSLQMNQLPEGVAVYRVHGPFLFGSTDKLEVIENDLETLPKIVVLRLRNMTAIDTTGVKAMEELAHKLQQTKRHLLLCGLRSQPAKMINQSELPSHVGAENILPNLTEAISRARQLLSES